MLPPSDREIVRSDPHLPGLSVVLDADALVETLRPHWPHARLTAVGHDYIRLKPGTSCIVGGTAVVDDQAWPIYTKVLPVGSPKLARPFDREPVAGPGGLVPVTIGRLGLTIWPFPNDAELRPLARLSRAGDRARLLSAVSAVDPSASTGRLVTLAYKPERRYVAAWTPEGQPSATLRLHAEAYSRALSAARLLRSCGDLRVPSLIGHADRWRAMLVDWVRGTSLIDVLHAPEADVASVFARVGAALAELHAQAPTGLPALGRAEIATAVNAASAHVAWTLPDVSGRASSLAQRVTQTLSGDWASVATAVHGDFYAKQVLIDAGHVAIVDLDDAALGDPMVDVGNFVAHLELDVVRGRLPADTAARAGAAFVSGYAVARGPGALNRLDGYVAAAIVKLAPRPFRDRAANWPEQTTALLERAEARVRPYRVRNSGAAHGRHAAPTVCVPDDGMASLLADPAFTFLGPAMDGPAVATWLQSSVAKQSVSLRRVVSRRVVRHKIGRRCLVEFEVETTEGVERWLAKVRARGVDARSAGFQDALWRGGFDDLSAHRVSVPEVIGQAPDLRLWIQRKVEAAEPLGADRFLAADAVWSETAQAIARLHACGVAPCRTHTLGDEIAILNERLAIVARHWPRRADQIARVQDACAAAAASCPIPTHAACLHRDFYFDQVLVHRHRLYLVDLDTAAAGDPALDAGNFIAHLLERAVRMPNHEREHQRAASLFRAAFLEASPGVDPRAVDVYTSLSLARLAAISTAFAERRAFTDALVDLCERRLAARSVSAAAGG